MWSIIECRLTISQPAAEDMGVEHNEMLAYGKPASSRGYGCGA